MLKVFTKVYEVRTTDSDSFLDKSTLFEKEVIHIFNDPDANNVDYVLLLDKKEKEEFFKELLSLDKNSNKTEVTEEMIKDYFKDENNFNFNSYIRVEN